jgi:hypothetical protein
MRTVAIVAAVCALTSPAVAQLRVGIQAGVTATSALLHDSIVQPITVQPGLAPSFAFTLETALDSTWSFSLGLGTAWSSLSQQSAGASQQVVPLTVWTPTVSLARTIRGPVVARASIGAIVYDPDHSAGNLFSQGSPRDPLVGVAVDFRQTRSGGMRYAVELGYDAHQFTTSALRSDGFSGAQLVHRITLSVSISRLVRQ